MTEPTGNESADAFLAELDAHIAGERGSAPDSIQRMRAMRPLIVAKIKADPEAFERWFEAEGQFILISDSGHSRGGTVDITIDPDSIGHDE